MGTVRVRVYGELDDLLAPRDRSHEVVVGVDGTPSVKDRIEAIGIPHTEVGLILVDGDPVVLDHHLVGGERIAVYPRFARLPRPGPDLRPPLPRPARFVADVHLATLARNLRLLGFDTVWDRALDDEDLARLSAEDERLLLTRDRLLLQRSIVVHGFYVRDDDPLDQTVELVAKLGLSDDVAPFGRCLACNDVPVPVAKDEVVDLLEPRTRRDHDRFRRCPGCGRIYWHGSHAEQLESLVAEILRRAAAAAPGLPETEHAPGPTAPRPPQDAGRRRPGGRAAPSGGG